jgi:hypothetical protein
MAENGTRFVRATADRAGLQMAKRFDWDFDTHPVLSWKWRPQQFPTGSDERESARNDSSLGVSVVFPQSPTSVKAIKYVWSERLPAGTLASTSRGLTRMIVLRSGKPKTPGWAEEAVNVILDYHRLFGESPKHRPHGIAVLTDADDTKGRAIGDYAAFRICTAPPSRHLGLGLLLLMSMGENSPLIRP